MENKDWREEFNGKFLKLGIPIGIIKYESKDGLDITPLKIISFIESLLKSKQEEIEKKIEEIHTELHNGRTEPAYRMICSLLSSLDKTLTDKE